MRFSASATSAGGQRQIAVFGPPDWSDQALAALPFAFGGVAFHAGDDAFDGGVPLELGNITNSWHGRAVVTGHRQRADAMLYRWPPNRQQTKHYRSDAQWSRSVLAVLFVGWLFGAPWLWLHGALEAAPFLGVTPTHDQEVEAATFMRWAVACGLLLPLTGLILSLATSQPIAAWLFGSAFTLTLVALFATGTVQNLNTNNTDGPTTSVVTPTRTPCAEHSGGVPRCPGDY